MIHLWEQINGENLYTEIPWVPYVFEKSSRGDIKDIFGNKVIKKSFANYNDYYTFCKDNPNILENKVRPEIQFLAERYHKIPDDELSVPNLKTYYIDIEVHREWGFPDPMVAEDPIVSISVRDSENKKIHVFGEKEYTGEMDIDYHHCPSERDLLKNFFHFMHNNAPDVISGWNIWGFDFPYLINRDKYLNGEKSRLYCLMSPINIVRTWMSNRENQLNVDIAGVCILDYMDVYKWYTPNNLESYSLDFVSKFELEKGKLDYSEYKDLREMYHKNWNKYIEYNAIDTVRPHDLENKLGYIKLIQALSLLTKAPMKYYVAMTQLIEGAMLTHYRRNNLCAPYFAGGTQEGFEAAHVKEPQKGMHQWVVDLDITSSYPSHIIALNMSVETYIGRIQGITEKQMVYYAKNGFPPFEMLKEESGMVKFSGARLDKFNMALKRKLISIAPCGSVFANSKGDQGVLAAVERQVFFKRKEVKGKMKEMRYKASQMENGPEKDKTTDRANELFSLQWAIKILLNAMFGILAVPYSRYFNTNIAEAITSCGRHTIKEGDRFVNEYYAEKNLPGMPKDVIAYIDTDSLFIRLGDYLNIIHGDDWNKFDDNKKIELILEESKVIEDYVNKRVFEETQLRDYNSIVEGFPISFKQEIVAKSALFVKKKKYAYWVVNEEGTPTDKLSVTGLDIVRSDSSEAIRGRLKQVMEMIMKDSPDEEIINMVSKYKKELKKVLPEEIAANIGVNNITKYIKDGKAIKGTPWHVKGVANYRVLLKYFGIENEYEDIYESTKAKVVYMKKNQFQIETITFNRWPHEFDKLLQIDYDIMIDKFFIKKIEFLLKPMDKLSLLTGSTTRKAVGAFFM